VAWTRNYVYNFVKERSEKIENIDDKEELTHDMLSMLLTANTQKDIIQGNNEKQMTHEEIADDIAEIIVEGVDSVCIECFYF
jgi:cytochrome P450